MVVREIRTAFMVVEVSIGLALNTVLIRLINRHTPQIMSVYSKVSSLLNVYCFKCLLKCFMIIYLTLNNYFRSYCKHA